MPVRSSFTAGEVLTAADLTDTFASKADYPSGGSNGDLLTKSGTTTAWATPPSLAGLVKIVDSTASSSSSFSVNNCFSSTYQNYKIVFVPTAASANQAITMRLRAGGTDATGSNYLATRIFWSASTSTVASTTTTSWAVGENASGTPTESAFDVEIYTPAEAVVTKALQRSTFKNGPGTHFADMRGLIHTVATAYDGFTLIPDTGNLSGVVRVYGYRN